MVTRSEKLAMGVTTDDDTGGFLMEKGRLAVMLRRTWTGLRPGLSGLRSSGRFLESRGVGQ